MINIFRLPDVISPLNPELERHLRVFKEAIETGGRFIEAITILDGNHLKGIALPATTNTIVNHKLGRKIEGWWTTDRGAAATIHRVTVSGEDTAKQITLYANAAVTVDLWVF